MRKYKNAEEAIEALREMKKNGSTYTPVQVLNSAQRSEAWSRKSGSAVQRAIWAKVVGIAEAQVQAAFANAKKSGKFIPCDENCMGSLSADCNCSCGGVNHSVHAAAAG